MKTNITPAKIVEMYLPEYEKRVGRKIKEINAKTEENPFAVLFQDELISAHFAEALAERDRILCEKQREVCADIYWRNVPKEYSPIKNYDKINSALMPTLKEE